MHRRPRLNSAALRRHLALVVTVLAGCGGGNPAVVSDADPNASFDGYRTFDLLDEGSGLEEDRIDVEEAEGFITEAIEAHLVEKGFRRVTDGTADFMVGFHLAINAQLSVEQMNTGYQYGAGWGWSNWGLGNGPILEPNPGRGGTTEYRQYYDEGMLVLDVMDRPTRRLVWRAAVHGRVDMNATSHERKHNLDRAVRQLLHDFPPR